VRGASFAAGLIGFTILLPSLPTPNGTIFVETRLCATGRIIRLELPNPDEPERPAPMPCHAVCARDDNRVKRLKPAAD